MAGAAGQPVSHNITLHPMGGSHVGGTAAIVYNAAKRTTTVTIRLHGLTPGIHFAHIHVGRCGGNGDVRYALAPMQAGHAGTASGVTVLPYRLSGSALHINVHGVPSQALKVVACGNL
jgi:Cu/Zn superoxide dismutase